MKRTILAILATLGLVLGTATMASAHNYFDSDPFGQNEYVRWSASYPTITVSDRTGYDMNEYEASWAWGSYSGDHVALAYTQAQTCTWCIRIVTKDVPNNIAEAGQYLSGGVAIQCTIYIDPDWANSHTEAASRQKLMARYLGHCLGFETATLTNYYTVMDATDATINPTSSDYAEMAYHY